MLLKKYQTESKRTCVSLGDIKLDLAHMVLGIISEQEEFLKAVALNDKPNIQEEIIDKVWYISNYCTFRGFDLEELYEDRYNFIEESWKNTVDINVVSISELSDYVKKYIAYNKPLDKGLEKNAIKAMLWHTNEQLEEFELDLYQGLQNNIDKLKARFPDKFTQENALNRNLENERKELEK